MPGDVADVQARLDGAEQAAHELPHREKYVPLTSGFMRRYLEVDVELIDALEREWHRSRPHRPSTSRP